MVPIGGACSLYFGCFNLRFKQCLTNGHPFVHPFVSGPALAPRISLSHRAGPKSPTPNSRGSVYLAQLLGTDLGDPDGPRVLMSFADQKVVPFLEDKID